MLAALWHDSLSSVSFLSRLPAWRLLPKDKRTTLPDFQRNAWAFPLAGLIIALPAALVMSVCAFTIHTPAVVALLTLATLVLTTGALHEDGLADVADGFWGGRDVAQKLAIMRDSAIGTYGVLALILSMALRVTLWAQVFAVFGLTNAVVLLVMVTALSRYAMLFPWVVLAAARPKDAKESDENGKETAGLSVRYGSPDHTTLFKGSLVATGLLAGLLYAMPFGAIAGAIIGGALATYGVMRLARHHVGGHTGDVLGATQQMSELGLLLGAFALM